MSSYKIKAKDFEEVAKIRLEKGLSYEKIYLGTGVPSSTVGKLFRLKEGNKANWEKIEKFIKEQKDVKN